MSAILHILNGDATAAGFNTSGIEGDAIIWREVFSEGPLSAAIDAEFWNTRAQWISETFHTTPDEYRANVLGQLEKLGNPYTEINLWFEFDLHCQVNLLGVMQLLSRQIDLDEPVISLICPDNYPGVEDFRGMGQLTGDQLEDLYESRVQLSEYDFKLAAEAWDVYVKQEGPALQQFIQSIGFWGNMHMLKPALEAHLKRLQKNENGLNHIQQTLKDIYDSGVTERAEIYKQFWAKEKIYGMGDSELDAYLQSIGI
ncbi:DUF1835 domain-containing protein [Mucilaginibacter sp. RS28]|uniref:DUF1835 domain-containing protein n=1 Tax=Mucilaginibacter straminoryzae TaxID=2932774 RepID=A0A9X2BAI3_9SPHI|nr:DUF1835 domain-containing protein [Mucilaginibacter straminoryzae]MCJ8210840.1 DUF1835 domain-containing protein [Mucilaginibacter straminoryzae]